MLIEETIFNEGPIEIVLPPYVCSFSHFLSQWSINEGRCKQHIIPVVPHKAVAEVSKIGNL
jgi:hypothetical protein